MSKRKSFGREKWKAKIAWFIVSHFLLWRVIKALAFSKLIDRAFPSKCPSWNGTNGRTPIALKQKASERKSMKAHWLRRPQRQTLSGPRFRVSPAVEIGRFETRTRHTGVSRRISHGSQPTLGALPVSPSRATNQEIVFGSDTHEANLIHLPAKPSSHQFCSFNSQLEPECRKISLLFSGKISWQLIHDCFWSWW